MNSNLDTQTNLYPFSQWDLPECKAKLKDIKNRYNGLCDIISNFILSFDLLGSEVDKNYLLNRITLRNLNSENFQNSHLMEVCTDAQKEKVLISGTYPYSILSDVDQRALIVHEKK